MFHSNLNVGNRRRSARSFFHASLSAEKANAGCRFDQAGIGRRLETMPAFALAWTPSREALGWRVPDAALQDTGLAHGAEDDGSSFKSPPDTGLVEGPPSSSSTAVSARLLLKQFAGSLHEASNPA